MTFLGKTQKDGTIDWGSPYNEARLRQYCRDFPGKLVRLAEVKEKRTLSQNSFYWKYLDAIERETGNDADDLHEFFKRKFLRPRIVTVMNQEVKLPASTTDLSKTEFGDYLDRICALTGVAIPDAEEYKDLRDRHLI